MRKRLWSKSIPFPLSSEVTPVKELVRSLMVYLDELFRYAVLVTTSCEFGTRRKLSTPGCNAGQPVVKTLAPFNGRTFEAGPTKSTISLNQTSTEQVSNPSFPAELWINSLNFPCLILLARYPKTKSNASIVLLFPLPLGPTIAEKDLWKGPIS